MAEALSVAGSAVGVISLAITTCQGVLSYYNSWENQNQSVSDAKSGIERLRNSLSALEVILPKVSSSSAIAGHVEQCVLSCKEGTARLEQFLGKCRKNPAPVSLPDKLREYRHKAIFPFRQSSLDSLNNIVRDLEGNLGTALQVLQLDTSEAQFRQTSELVDITKSTALSLDGTSQVMSIVEQKMDVIVGAMPQIQQGVARLTSGVPTPQSPFQSGDDRVERRLRAIESWAARFLPALQNKVDQLPHLIQESLAGPTASAELHPSVETSGSNTSNSALSVALTNMDEDARKLQLSLAKRPSLLRAVCDDVRGLEMDIGLISAVMARSGIRRGGKRTEQRSYCSCSTLVRKKTATYSVGIVEFFKSSVESCKHSIDCPLYIGTEATTTAGLKLAYYSRLLANTVGATLSITSGAGGFSINPCLRFRARVSSNSPAFRLLDQYVLRGRLESTSTSQTNEICEVFESTLRQMYDLFKDKAASPTDLNEYGQTLIMAFCYGVINIDKYSIEVFQSGRNLLKGLIAAGVPLNELDDWEDSCLDQLANHYEHYDDETSNRYFDVLAMDAFEAGAELSDSWLLESIYYDRNPVSSLEIKTRFDKWIDDCSCGVLSAAILCRSERDVEQILQNSPQSIHEQNARCQTPLHLAYNWPKGITLLLRHGGRELVNREDSEGHLPLSYSCASKCLEAVELLLGADSALYPMVGNYGVYEAAINRSTDEIMTHLETALIDRRTRLHTLAITKLSRTDLEELDIADDRFLDEKAYDLYKALELRNVFIPSALRTPGIRTTLFHIVKLSPSLSESLYKRGFIDLDGIDVAGLTPLMRIDGACLENLKPALQRFSWLVSKGADPGRKPDKFEGMRRDASTTAAHHICAWVGRAVYEPHRHNPNWGLREISRTWLFGALDDLGEDCQLLLKRLISSKLCDDCICACSGHGCTPATMMLKGVAEWLAYGQYLGFPSLINAIEQRLRMIEWVDDLLGHRHEAWQWLSSEIIRYATFEGLGLTHTCCAIDKYGYAMPTPMDGLEVAEIRDEERLSISRLETLVAEFEEKYIELGVPVSEFLKGYWRARMDEVPEEEEPLDEEEIARIRNVGVVIHS